MAKYDKNNCECPDKTPIEIPLGYTAPESLSDLIARIVHNQNFQAQLNAQGADTIEEAEDFDTGDDDEIKSEHEMSEMLDEFVAATTVPQPTATTVPEPTPAIPANT